MNEATKLQLVSAIKNLPPVRCASYDIEALPLPVVAQAVTDITHDDFGLNEAIVSPEMSDVLNLAGYQGRAQNWGKYRLEGTDLKPGYYIEAKSYLASGTDRHMIDMTGNGLPVYAPVIIVDEHFDRLVYLEMVGPPQSVKANWAALMNGGRKARHRIYWSGGSDIVILRGMQDHFKLTASLPCGWSQMILMHKQATMKLEPGLPFYVLAEDKGLPTRFYDLLNLSIPVPILPEWTPYLWLAGNKNKVTAIPGREQHGLYCYRVQGQKWDEVVTNGMQQSHIQIEVGV